MQVQSINNNAPSFGALYINSKAKAIIERQSGGREAIEKYTKELADTKWDLWIKDLGEDNIFSTWTGGRQVCISPLDKPINEYLRVYSVDELGDGEEDIVDYLKFSSAERAQEVYNQMEEACDAAYNNKEHTLMNGSYFNPLGELHRDVLSLKVLEEAEHISRDESPWKRPALVEQPLKTAVKQPAEQTIEKKPSFSQRLKDAWNVLLGK